MAYTIPETFPPQSGTPGERRVFKALRDHLPEDYLVYYDIAIGGRHPDFVVIGPDLGLVVLEVKDWRLSSIGGVTEDGVVLRKESGESLVKHPVRQVREYVLMIVDRLKKRSLLYDGQNLAFRWGYGVVFPLLKKKELEKQSLFGPSLADALGQREILASEDLQGECLTRALRRLLPDRVPAREPLSPLQVDEVRGALQPEIRIGWGCTDEDIVPVMDREQERLARTVGEGHRMVRGVAGSGKTIILTCRARHLAERFPDWRILVICYNRVLADELRVQIGQGQNLEVAHYHAWCIRKLRGAGVAVPPLPESKADVHEYWDRSIPRLLLETHDAGRFRPNLYQAILIDEGQDFADEWYRTLLRVLDAETNSLYIALDSSQTIYSRKVSWRDVGVHIVGRTRVLRVNYRNTDPILAAAYTLIRDMDASAGKAAESSGEYVVPEKALRNGPRPEIRRFSSFEAERQHALERLQAWLAEGIDPTAIMVVGLSRSEMAKLGKWLGSAGLPTRLLGRQSPSTGGIRLSTIHSAKGLDAEAVLIFGVQELRNWEHQEAHRLMYIAMTRARTRLCISSSADSPLMAYLAGIA